MYYNKYLKYKAKYLDLKSQSGGDVYLKCSERLELEKIQKINGPNSLFYYKVNLNDKKSKLGIKNINVGLYIIINFSVFSPSEIVLKWLFPFFRPSLKSVIASSDIFALLIFDLIKISRHRTIPVEKKFIFLKKSFLKIFIPQ